MSKFFTFLFFILGFSTFGQGLLNNGAYINVTTSAVVTVTGSTGHFINQKDALQPLAPATTEVEGSLFLQGNFVNSSGATFTSILGLVTFNGVSTQEFWSGSGTYKNITFNNSASGTNDIVLRDALTINGTGTFSDGIVNYNGGSLTFANGATCPLGGSVSSFVNTTSTNIVAKNGTNAFIFPTGEVSGSNVVWAPIGIGSFSNPSYITANYKFAASPDNYNMCNISVMYKTSGIEYWELNTTDALPPVTLYWKDAARSEITVPSELVVGYFTSSPCWESKGAAGLSVVGNTGSITSNAGFSSYGKITFGASKSNSNPLPIALVDFTANCINNRAKIEWITASEINNSFFTVERSLDGIDWTDIATIPGAGNSNELHNYSYIDESHFNQTVYYRLQQTDFDGNFDHSSPVSINCFAENGDMDISVFPNPFNDEVTINFNNFNFSDAILNVVDVLGNKIAERKCNDINSSGYNTTFDLGTMAKGIYFIEVTSGGFTKNFKIVKN